jgi:glycosyl-4,4'-diaponeurosporenoate acyltransferase
MVIPMSNTWSLILSAMLWPAWGFFTGWWYRRQHPELLLRDRWHVRTRQFERNGQWYDGRLNIRRWKDRLPETGGWFGVSKKELPGLSTPDLELFLIECRRGELTHWAILFVTPAFAIWNSGLALFIVVCVGLAASIPFIAVLRYNQLRIMRILARREF